MKRPCCAWILLLFTLPALAQGTRRFGAATFIPPHGWDVEDRPTPLAYSRIRGNALCMIVIYKDEPSPSLLEEAFASAWSSIFSRGYQSAPLPASRLETSSAGYRHAAGAGELVDNGGNRYVARLHVFPSRERTQSIVWLGNSSAALEGCRSDWEAFFGSLRFPDVPVPAAPPAAAPAPAVPAPSAPTQFENVIFTPPPGWSRQRHPDAVILSPTDTQGGEMLQVLILKGRVSKARLDEEFALAWSELQSALGAQGMTTVNSTSYDLDEPGRSARGTEYRHGTGGLRREDGIYTVGLYMMRAGERIERVATLARDFRENLLEANASMNPRYSAAIHKLVFTLRFANRVEPALPPVSIRGGGITGVWAGEAMSLGRIRPHFAVFFTNGIAYFGPQFPIEGLADIDPYVEQSVQTRYWGTYSMTGETGVLTMPYGKVPLRTIGPALELTTNQTPHRFFRLEMPKSGRLEGNWCLEEGCLRLTAAGRFQDTGAVRVLEHVTYAYPASPERGEGQYELRDHTLLLRYDRGPHVRISFPGLTGDPANDSPRELLLSFNYDVLTRR